MPGTKSGDPKEDREPSPGKDPFFPLRPHPDRQFPWSLGRDRGVFLKVHRHMPDRRAAKSASLQQFVPPGAYLTVDDRSINKYARIPLPVAFLRDMDLLHNVSVGDESRLQLREDLHFALGYDVGNAATRFILLRCRHPHGPTFEEHLEFLAFKVAFTEKLVGVHMATATEDEIRQAQAFHPYCGTGCLGGNEYVMPFRDIRFCYQWAVLRAESCSVRKEPYVFLEPPPRLLEGCTPDQRKTGRSAVYLYSHGPGNIAFEIVPLALQYALGCNSPQPIVFGSEYLTRLPITPAFRR